MSCCTAWRREEDPELHDFYARNLLEPGWAGELNRVELAYIKAQLRQSASLRRRWGFRPSAKRLSPAHIRAAAMDGVSGHARGVLASVRRDNRRRAREEHQGEARAWTVSYKTASPRA